MKIGLDFHGVLNTLPVLIELSELLVKNGHEVHVITGGMKQNMESELNVSGMVYGVHYSHFFSISDSLIAKGEVPTWDAPGRPMFDDDIWNKTKATYCRDHGIELHLDDSDIYGSYFTTPYAQITKVS